MCEKEGVCEVKFIPYYCRGNDTFDIVVEIRGCKSVGHTFPVRDDGIFEHRIKMVVDMHSLNEEEKFQLRAIVSHTKGRVRRYIIRRQTRPRRFPQRRGHIVW